MNRKMNMNQELMLNELLPYVCLLFFLLVQASVSLRMILELLNLVPGAFYGLTGAFMVFSFTISLMVKVLLWISEMTDKTAVDKVFTQRMAAGCMICFGLIYRAAVGFRDGETALFYYKAMNLQILLPWTAAGIHAVVQDKIYRQKE